MMPPSDVDFAPAPLVPMPPVSESLSPVAPGRWFFLVCPWDIKGFPERMRPHRHGFAVASVWRKPGEIQAWEPWRAAEFVADPRQVAILIGKNPVIAWSRKAVCRNIAGEIDGHAVPPPRWREFRYLSEHPQREACGPGFGGLYGASKRCLGLDAIEPVFPSSQAFIWCLSEMASLLAAAETVSRERSNPDGGLGR